MSKVHAVKRSPQMRHLDETLRSSKLSAGGFLGHDSRVVEEIIEADCAAVARLGYTVSELADRMSAITEMAERPIA